MGKKARRDSPDVPWITEEGFLDPATYPIEPILRQSLSRGFDSFRSACDFLGMMASHGRIDARIYLLGLLRHHRDDLERLDAVVESLGAIRNEACANALFDELRRVKSSNATRRYLNEVIEALTRFPREMVEAGFDALAADPSFSYRMRKKFATAVRPADSGRDLWDD